MTLSTEHPENVDDMGTRTSRAQQCTGNLIRGGRLRPEDDPQTCEKEPLTWSCTAVSLEMLLSIFPFYHTQFPFQDSEELNIWATAEAELALVLTSECIVSHPLVCSWRRLTELCFQITDLHPQEPPQGWEQSFRCPWTSCLCHFNSATWTT